jgi:hypothetical protein
LRIIIFLFHEHLNVASKFKVTLNKKDLLREKNWGNVKNIITFRYTVYGYAEYTGSTGHMNDSLTDKKVQTFTITVYNLNPGIIGADTVNNPNVGDKNFPKYAIYDVSPSNVNIINEESPSIENTSGDESVLFNIGSFPYNGNGNKVTIHSTNQNLNVSLDKDKICNNSIDYNKTYDVTRSVQLTVNKGTSDERTFTWTTDTLHYIIVPPVTLPNLRGEDTISYACPGSSDNEDANILNLKGAKIAKNPLYSSYNYGEMYGWQYTTSGFSDWRDVTSTSGKQWQSDPNFSIYKTTFMTGTSVKFRQVVKLTKFNNRIIYADAVNATDEWKSYYDFRKYSRIAIGQFAITPQSKLTKCAGDNYNDADNVVVTFNPAKNAKYCSMTGSPIENHFTYAWKYTDRLEEDAQTALVGTDSILNLSTSTIGNSSASNNKITVSITDGCHISDSYSNATDVVTLTTTTHVDTLPTISNNSFTVIVGQKDPTTASNVLTVQVSKGNSFGLTIAEPNKNAYSYYYKMGADGAETKMATTTMFSPDEIQKIANLGQQVTIFKRNIKGNAICTSALLSLNVNIIQNLTGGRIWSTYSNEKGTNNDFVCKGSKSPELFGDNAIGGYSTSTTTTAQTYEYGYFWQKSLNQVNWQAINAESMQNLPEGAITGINTPVYVRRIVVNTSAAGAILRDTSKIFTISPFSMPDYSLVVSPTEEGVYTSTNPYKVCNGTNIFYKVLSLNSEAVKSAQPKWNTSYAPSVKYAFTFTTPNAVSTFTESGSVDSMQISQYMKSMPGNTSIICKVYACNDSITLPKQIIETDEDLTMKLRDITLPACLVQGKTATVKVTTPGDYDYSVNGITGTSFSIPLEELSQTTFRITKSNKNCSATSDITISEVSNAIPALPLTISGAKYQNGKYIVCADKQIPITQTSANSLSVWKYIWRKDEIGQSDTTRTLATSFPDYGTSYSVTRETQYWADGNLCDTHTDTIHVQTYAKLSVTGKLTAPATICYGDSVKITSGITTAGGSGAVSYAWYKTTDNITYSEASNESATSQNYQISELTADTRFRLTVSDAVCPNYKNDLYANITVAPNLKITSDQVATTPTYLSRSIFSDSSSHSATVTINTRGETSVLFIFKDETETSGKTYSSAGASTTSRNYEVSPADIEGADVISLPYCLVRNFVTSDNKTCKSNKYCSSISINDGFEGNLEISASNAKDTVVLCPSETTTLSVSTYPKYNSAEITKSGTLSYQWRRAIPGTSTYYVVHEGTEYQSINISADAAGADYSYYCVLKYTDTGNNVLKVASNKILVKGIKSLSAGFVTDAAGNKTITVCKFSSPEISLSCESDFQKTHRWKWEISTDLKQWDSIPNNYYFNGEKNSFKQPYPIADIRTTTYIRCVAIGYCGDSALSSNNYTIKLTDEKIDASDILSETPELLPSAGIASVNFSSIPDANKSVYYWSADRNKNFQSGNSHAFVAEALRIAGDHTVYIYKKDTIHGCISDTIAQNYTLYDSLSYTAAVTDIKNKILCKNSIVSPLNINIQNIAGGNTKKPYVVTFYYKTADMTGYASLTSETESDGFSYNVTENLGDYKLSITKGLSQTTSFYAIISNEGYPGGNVKTDIVTYNVYSPMTPGRIDGNTTNLCYDTYEDIKSVSLPTGGSGNYSYQWIKSEDSGTSWVKIDGMTGNDYTPNRKEYALTKNTMFKRVVTDNSCHTTDTTLSARTFNVGNEIIIADTEMTYLSKVEIGSKGIFSGKNQGDTYEFFDYTGIDTLGTAPGTKSWSSSPLTSETIFKAKKHDLLGCESSNSLTLTVSVKDKLNGGTIYLEKQPDNETKWLCSGDSIGRVLNNVSPNGSNMTFKWLYNDITKKAWYTLNGKTSNQPVTTLTVDLDTCNVSLVNTSGAEEIFKLCRITYSNDGTTTESSISDTIEVRIAPTLQSVAKTKLLLGTLSVAKNRYCYAEAGGEITLNMDSVIKAVWDTPDFGALKYGNNLLTYWEIQKGTEKYKTVEKSLTNYTENGSYLSAYALDSVKGSYSIRFSISDGCTSVSTDAVKQSAVILTSISDTTFSITPKGAEVGDQIRIVSKNLEPCVYFYDATCQDTIGKTRSVNVPSIKPSTLVFYKAYENSDHTGCQTEAYPVPLTIYAKSKPGLVIGDQKICYNTTFDSLYSASQATGSTGAFAYQWQYTTTPTASSSWKNITGANGLSISANLLNSVTKGMASYYVRRQATNEFGRAIYSDTVTLSHFDELTAGKLGWADSSITYSFCQDTKLPNITTSVPTGGVSGFYGQPYKYGWEIAVNSDTAYHTIMSPSESNSRRLDLSFVLPDLKYSKSVNNTFYVRAIYGDRTCGTAYSAPFKFTIYRTAENPSIYQEKDSCNASTVTITVENTTDYQYEWMVYDTLDSLVWDYPAEKKITSKTLNRVTEYNAQYYGIKAFALPAYGNCVSGTTYFTLDSLPKLSQDSLSGISKQCYNASFTLPMSEAKGGSGTKTYQWQYSYDNKSYSAESGATTATLSYANIKQRTYFRRIATDMCSSDTSNSVAVEVYDSIPLVGVSFEDRKCPNQKFNVLLRTTATTANADYLKTYVFDTLSYTNNVLDYAKAQCALRCDAKTTGTIDGFEGVSKNYAVVTASVVNNIPVCLSRFMTATAYNVSDIVASRNKITCLKKTPCNGDEVAIKGDSATAKGADATHIEYSWYTSKDGKTWTKSLLLDGVSANLAITDTMFVKRGVTNGCNDTTYFSNILSFVGQKLDDYDYPVGMDLSIVTSVSDSSSIVNLKIGTVDFLQFSASGDGIVKDLAYGSNILPYNAEIYADSMLLLRKNAGCMTSYRVVPVSGGRISLDGTGEVCKGAALPAIVATAVAGGDSTYTYQWQYKNDNVASYVDIEGATTKNYTPTAVEGKTSFRRITYSGRYMSVSNAVTVEIVQKPVFSRIKTDKDSSFFVKYGLKYTSSSVQKTENLDLSLVDTVFGNADAVYYQTQKNGVWTRVSDKASSNGEKILTLALSDSISAGKYRVFAVYPCGSDSSAEFTVTTVGVSPIYDDELVVVQPACQGDTASIEVFDNAKHAVTGNYTYSLVISDGRTTKAFPAGVKQLIPVSSSVSATLTRRTVGAVDSLDISSYRVINLVVDTLIPSFTYTTVDGVEHSLTEDNVTISQGERIQFNNKSVGATAYYWQLLKPLNLNLISYDISEAAGGKGLVSRLENPVCYFYNSNNYVVTLKVTNGKGCSKQISNNAFVLPYTAVRSTYGIADASFVENGSDESEYVFKSINVFPTLFNESVSILCKGEYLSYQMFNAQGIVVKAGNGQSELNVSTSNLIPGYYTLVVNDQIFKLLKK